MSDFLIGSSVQVLETGKEQTPALVMGHDAQADTYQVRFEGGETQTVPASQLKNWCTCEI
ncbi:hypothetical protein JOC36_000544 [Weissella uvarum]|uniref:hypothetical protein n=1 Tax=Weissella uvarum TaxID=1479233 RepID=UPI00195FB729|nr:hypothetical protein [Weissella uvarum]MBM7616995.1 hypothetical protein [Weissella uvarum]MCM0595295.1 hypothetical protein [Weissella uvarum]